MKIGSSKFVATFATEHRTGGTFSATSWTFYQCEWGTTVVAELARTSRLATLGTDCLSPIDLACVNLRGRGFFLDVLDHFFGSGGRNLDTFSGRIFGA